MIAEKLRRFNGNNAWFVNEKGCIIIVPDSTDRFEMPPAEMEAALVIAAHVKAEYELERDCVMYQAENKEEK